MIGPNDRPRFAAHATPEQIAAERQSAGRYLDRARRYVLWLDTLAAQRAQQVAAGAWPKRAEGSK